MRHLAVATPPPAAGGGWTLEASDTFGRTAGDQTGWTDTYGAGGSWGCDGSGSFVGGQGYQIPYSFNTEATSADVAIEVDHTCSANSADVYIWGRTQSASSTGCKYRLQGTTLYSPDGTPVATSLSYGANPTLRLELVGTAVEFFIDGASVYTGTAATSGGSGNNYVAIVLTSSIKIDELRIYT